MARQAAGWAIAHPHGLYVGWWLTRVEAIAGHIEIIEGVGNTYGSELTDEQRRLWAARKRKGDRAVKVKLTYT
jgi:hypothetical protein